ncbi:Uncharacterised protein [Chlamydia abortus]|nr:Uncharacterised protein [Chlamydia abortus]
MEQHEKSPDYLGSEILLVIYKEIAVSLIHERAWVKLIDTQNKIFYRSIRLCLP